MMNKLNPNKIDQLIDATERIGVIGSPSSTSEFSLDILGSAVTQKLVGELALFRYLQDNSQHYALGQITEITLQNSWHEDPTIRSLIRQRGRVDAVSERQDTHRGKMTFSAVFASSSHGYRPSILGTVPATGTPIHIVDDEVIEELLSPYKQQLFYLGYVYGSTPKLPLWFKHFDSGKDGAGEAYHLGIFGKTGSGKSVLAKTVLLAYAKHKQMGLFVFDPQGEFSLGLRHSDGPKHMGQILCPSSLKSLGRNFQLYDLNKIQLDRWEIFAELLVESGFFFDLGIKNRPYQEAAADYIEEFLKKHKEYTLKTLSEQQVFIDSLNHLSTNINRVYAGKSGSDRVQDFISEVIRNVQGSGVVEFHPTKDKWDLTASFFKGNEKTKSPTQIVKSALKQDRDGKRIMTVVDLSKRPSGVSQNDWDEKIKPLLIDRFLDELIREAENAYQDEKSLNTLVVLDEAHRLAPQERSKNERKERIKSNLVDAARTTRKYGLGWMFISQTLASLDSDIVQMLRIYFMGFGLSMGTEYQKLRELAGGQKDSLSLYQRFRDPQSSFDAASREYPFMTIGPVSPLSFSGTPLFLNTFNRVEDFVQSNRFQIQGTLPLYGR